MDKPTCRLCGAKHWNHEPHQFKGAVRTQSKPPSDVRAQEIKQLKARIAELESQLVNVATGPCPKCEARKRKNRERMAKRRAES